MFDIRHQLTEEESKLVEDVFNAKNEVKRLKDSRFIYQKDLEILNDDNKNHYGTLFVAAIPALFFWLFTLADLVIIFITGGNKMLIAIVGASLAPIMALIATIFFFVYRSKYLMVYSKNEKHIARAKKANVQNKEALRRETVRKYTDISDQLQEAEAKYKTLQTELDRLEQASYEEEARKDAETLEKYGKKSPSDNNMEEKSLEVVKRDNMLNNTDIKIKENEEKES